MYANRDKLEKTLTTSNTKTALISNQFLTTKIQFLQILIFYIFVLIKFPLFTSRLKDRLLLSIRQKTATNQTESFCPVDRQFIVQYKCLSTVVEKIKFQRSLHKKTILRNFIYNIVNLTIAHIIIYFIQNFMSFTDENKFSKILTTFNFCF